MPKAGRTKRSTPKARSDAGVRGRDTAELVLTPGGWRPRSHVHHVPPYHVVRHRHDRVTITDKATGEDVKHIDLMSDVIAGPFGDGWVVLCKYVNDTGSPVTSFSTRWTVPEPPRTQSDQTIFLFNGMMDAGERTIVQPVLQWGVSAIGGGPFWTISTWHVLPTGNVLHSTPVPVQPHDLLVGSIALSGTGEEGFDYVTEFAGEPSTRMDFQSFPELTTCTETLETNGTKQCSDYPASAATAFTAINIRTGATAPPVSWTAVDVLTDCGQHARIVSNSGTNGAVTLSYPTS